jgi:hypothetical protein
MNNLIKALTILGKYTDSEYPTGCEHDVLYVYVSPDSVSGEDILMLANLGFDIDEDIDCFYSFHYGSA